jgi:hypothetical protein
VAFLRSALTKALPPTWLRQARQIIESAELLKETAFDARLARADKQRYPALQENDLANAVIVGNKESRPIDELQAIAERLTNQGLRSQLLD